MPDDFEKVARLGVAPWAEHPHQALRQLAREPAQFLKADGGVDVVAKNRLAGIEIAGEKALDAFAQKFLAEFGILLDARLNRPFEAACQRHPISPCGACNPSSGRGRFEYPCSGASWCRHRAGSRASLHPCRNRPGSRAEINPEFIPARTHAFRV